MVVVGAGKGPGNADALYPETLTQALKEITEELGTPDVLVYNVAITEPDGEREITSEFLKERFQIDDFYRRWFCENISSVAVIESSLY